MIPYLSLEIFRPIANQYWSIFFRCKVVHSMLVTLTFMGTRLAVLNDSRSIEDRFKQPISRVHFYRTPYTQRWIVFVQKHHEETPFKGEFLLQSGSPRINFLFSERKKKTLCFRSVIMQRHVRVFVQKIGGKKGREERTVFTRVSKMRRRSIALTMAARSIEYTGCDGKKSHLSRCKHRKTSFFFASQLSNSCNDHHDPWFPSRAARTLVLSTLSFCNRTKRRSVTCLTRNTVFISVARINLDPYPFHFLLLPLYLYLSCFCWKPASFCFDFLLCFHCLCVLTFAVVSFFQNLPFLPPFPFVIFVFLPFVFLFVFLFSRKRERESVKWNRIDFHSLLY